MWNRKHCAESSTLCGIVNTLWNRQHFVEYCNSVWNHQQSPIFFRTGTGIQAPSGIWNTQSNNSRMSNYKPETTDGQNITLSKEGLSKYKLLTPDYSLQNQQHDTSGSLWIRQINSDANTTSPTYAWTRRNPLSTNHITPTPPGYPQQNTPFLTTQAHRDRRIDNNDARCHAQLNPTPTTNANKMTNAIAYHPEFRRNKINTYDSATAQIGHPQRGDRVANTYF
jgi:hypothetical protein